LTPQFSSYNYPLLGTIDMTKLAEQCSDLKEDDINELFRDELRRQIKTQDSSELRIVLQHLREQLPDDSASDLRGFDYRIEADPDTNIIRSIIWQTARMRARTEVYGEMLFFDGKEKVNKEKFPIFLLTVVDANNKIGRAAVGVSVVEDGSALEFMLRSLRDLTPGWKPKSRCIMMDVKLTEKSVHAVFSDAHVMVCTWHWLEQNLQANLGRLQDYDLIKDKVYRMKSARDVQTFEEIWEECKLRHRVAVGYTIYITSTTITTTTINTTNHRHHHHD
jgi:hypothetical protein